MYINKNLIESLPNMITILFLSVFLTVSQTRGLDGTNKFLTTKMERISNLSYLIDAQDVGTMYNTANEDSNVTLVGRWGYGGCHSVAVQETLAFIGTGKTLQILDISEPSSPIKIGKFDSKETVVDILLSENIAFIASAGLVILNISDPSNPTEIAYLPGSVNKIYVRESCAYLTGGNYATGGTLSIVDISDLSNPVLMGSCNTPSGAYGIQVVGNYVYIANELAGLRIIDISEPSNPHEVGFWDPETLYVEVYGCRVRNHYAYITDFLYGLRIIDVSEPTMPYEIGSYDTYGVANDVFVNGDYAYIAEGFEFPPPAPPPKPGLRIIDISDPQNPHQIGYFNTFEWCDQVFISDKSAYLASRERGLRIVDISNPSNLNEIGYYSSGGNARGVFADGDYAYCTYAWTDLRILDVSDPSDPLEVGLFNEGGSQSFGIYASGDYAYITDLDTFRIIDITIPTNPHQAGYFYLPDQTIAVFVVGDYAYVTAGGSYGMIVLDVSNPSNPVMVGSSNTSGGPDNLFVSGNYAYLADGADGLWIIDITIPTNPVPVGRLTGISANDVWVVGDYAFVADVWYGLRVIDVSDPYYPFEMSSLEMDGPATAISVYGNQAYIANGGNGLRVIDITEPSNPYEVGYYIISSTETIPSYVWDVYVDNGYVYVSDAWQGTFIFRYSLLVNVGEDHFYSSPEKFKLFQNYPNPFNSVTIIPYSLSKKVFVDLTVYDVVGHQVKKVVNSVQSQGSYNVLWDGRNKNGQYVSSGVYFIALRTGESHQTRKMVLVK